MHNWNFVKTQPSCEFSEQIVNSILRCFRSGFGIAGWSEEGVKKKLLDSSLVGLLQSGSDKTVDGYALYYIPSVPLDKQFMLWENAICITKNMQGKGFSRQALDLALKNCPEYNFGFVGGKPKIPLL